MEENGFSLKRKMEWKADTQCIFWHKDNMKLDTESFHVNEEKDMRRKQQQCLWTTFFSKELVRIQADADEDNMAS